MHRPLIVALLLALVVCAASACSGSSGTPAAASVTTAASTIRAASSPAPSASGPQAAACRTLAATTFDLSSQESIGRIQDQMDASLKFLPHLDQLNMDIVTAEQPLVDVDIDLASEAKTGSTSATMQSDIDALQSALQPMETDCSAVGVPFTVALRTIP